MKKAILLLIIVLSVLVGGYLFYAFKINNPEKEYHKDLSPKDLNPESFITLFKEKYNKKSQLNSVTLAGEFPENWVKQKDIPYLISIMNSKEKCCGYMNIFSSNISKEDAEVGGFALIFFRFLYFQNKNKFGFKQLSENKQRINQKNRKLV